MKDFIRIYGTDIAISVGDEVENNSARFFVGAINDSHNLCSIDKSKPFTLKDPKDPMADCIRRGSYSANAITLKVIK